MLIVTTWTDCVFSSSTLRSRSGWRYSRSIRSSRCGFPIVPQETYVNVIQIVVEVVVLTSSCNFSIFSKVSIVEMHSLQWTRGSSIDNYFSVFDEIVMPITMIMIEIIMVTSILAIGFILMF